jgi:hypothetical protein
MARVLDTITSDPHQRLAGAALAMVVAIGAIPHTLRATLGQFLRSSGLTGRVTDVMAGDTVMATLDIVARAEAAIHGIASTLIRRVTR